MKKLFFLAGVVVMCSTQSCRSDEDFIARPVSAYAAGSTPTPDFNRPGDSTVVQTDSIEITETFPRRKDPIQWITITEIRRKLEEARKAILPQ